jgi:putative ABC transport system ATP-binding protein
MSDTSDIERWRPKGRDTERAAFRTPDRDAADASPLWRRQDDRPRDLYKPIVEVEGLLRDYPIGDTVVHALRGIDVRVQRGQLVAVQGRSGSGKTTLLNMIGGLDRPTSGRVWIDGAEVTALPESHLLDLRRKKLGFIFQAFGLIPILSAAENVEVPLRLMNAPVAQREERVRVLLELVGLGERMGHRPHELSGGEQQRVAIARALANTPELLLADEPTGQLDSGTARNIMILLRALVESEGVTAIVATHDPVLIDIADRVIELVDGQVTADSAAVLA